MSGQFSFLESALARDVGTDTLQRQLIGRLKQAILSGQLKAGEKLPSSRALAEELKVSRNTVLIAYEQLVAEGYIVADRRGSRVAQLSGGTGSSLQAFSASNVKSANNVSENASKPVVASPSPPSLLPAQRLAHIVPSNIGHGSTLPFTSGLPALNQFPVSAWRKAYDKALHAPLSQILGYGDPLGEPLLRQAIAQHVRVSRGVRCDASHIVVTEGAYEALSLCVRLFTNPGDTAWMEDPGYRGAKAAFYTGDLNVIPMRVDNQGIMIPPQAWSMHPPRLIQTTPSHQFPTGAVLSVTRRLELIKHARQVGAWIIEDDYDSEFRHQGEPIAAMQGLLVDAPVLYVGTFSKTMFPALRLGFLVLPASIAPVVMPSIHELLRGGHRLEQRAMAAFIESGQFSRHLGRMRRLYRERQSALREALANELECEHEVLGGNSGLHLTVRLPQLLPHRFCDRALVEEARRQGMNPGALSTFAIAPRPEDNGLVLGYGNTPAERFVPLVKQLSTMRKLR